MVVTAERGARDALQSMRLYNSSDVAMRADPEQQPILQLGSNQVARYYAVPPADYLLSFRSITGETLQQTLPAFRDRTTLVFLEQVSANVLVADGETFTVEEQESRGIDVARTVSGVREVKARQVEIPPIPPFVA